MIMEPACVNHLEDGKTVEITCECFSCGKEVSFNVSEEGWDLLETFDAMLNALSKGLTKAKRDPKKFTRRGRGRESS